MDKDYMDSVNLDYEHKRQLQMQASQFGGADNSNLVTWQLDTKEILDQIEHNLRGDVVKVDEKGDEIWVKSTKEQGLAMLNDKGVNAIMKILSMYLNRNSILSATKEEEVNEMLYTIGMEIGYNLVLNYRNYGWEKAEMRRNYNLLVIMVTDQIALTLKRSIGGGERSSLREARSVTQSEALNNQNLISPMGYGQKRGILSRLPKLW